VSLTAFVEQQSATVTQDDFITVNPAPLVVDFDAATKLGVIPLQVAFSETSTGATTTAWSWDFGDGTTSALQNPTHSYSVRGDYTVSFTAFVGQQNDTLVQKNFITVNPGPFGPQRVITTAAIGAQSVYAADLDGDGDADVLSTSNSQLAWYENTDGLGTFGPQQHITTSIAGADSVYVTDLDGDGDMDVLSASAFDDQIAWYENVNGLGRFGLQKLITHAADYANGVHAADLDGDGDMDVLSASYFDDKIAWYRNTDGQGTFGRQQVITKRADRAQSVYAADLDADGDMDVLSAQYAQNTPPFDSQVAWYENTDGQGSFGPQQGITTMAYGAESVFAADLDGDGDADVLSASSSDDKIAWYENTNGQGIFGLQQVITTTANSAYSVYATDLDGDGDSDVLSASIDDDKIAWYENKDGLGNFGTQQVITTAADYAASVYATDLDGDGDVDVLSASFFDDKIAWYSNLLASPAWPILGNGLAGMSGIPVLTGDGLLVADAVVSLSLTNAPPGNATTLVMGLSVLSAPFNGGVMVPSPDVVIAGLLVDGAGGLVLTDRWPPGIPTGVTIWFQHWIHDSAGPQGLAASNGLSGTTSP
jgi:PKD repeat protein